MKKLLAIAIAAGMAAPVFADATLYGQLHASLDVLDGAGDAETTVSSNSSRIGIKGSVDLTAGLKAIYKAEWGMDTGGSKNGLSDRNQVVGVAGGFGAVLIGRHDTPLKIIGRKADLFWSTQVGQNRSIVASEANNGLGWDARADNVVAYQSPKMGGFQALAAYVTEDGATGGGDAFSINGIYNAGPLMVGAAYETHSDTLNQALNSNTTAAESTAMRLMASYKFGAAKVVGFYQATTDEGGTAAADVKTWGLGGSYKVSSAGTVKAQYYKNDKTVEQSLFALGYDHSLGKSTAVYAQYAMTDGSLGIGGSGHGEKVSADGSGDSDAFSVGIRHKF
jgi:predicted porin